MRQKKRKKAIPVRLVCTLKQSAGAEESVLKVRRDPLGASLHVSELGTFS